MEELIRSCEERDLDGVIKYFNTEVFPVDEKEQGGYIIESVIRNSDLEILEILLKNNIVFDERCLEFLPFAHEDIFLKVYKYIETHKKTLKINFNNYPDFLLDICKSYSSTEKMFSLAINSDYFDMNYTDSTGKNVAHIIVCFNKLDFMKHLEGRHVGYMEKDNYGLTIFDYAMRRESKNMMAEIVGLPEVMCSLFVKNHGITQFIK